MKMYSSICIVLLAAMINMNPVFGVGTPQVLSNNLVVVSEDLNTKLATKAVEFSDSMWPKNLDSNKVDRSEIPDVALGKSNFWIKTIVKQEWLPTEPNDWLIGVRKRAPIEADYMVMRYKIGDDVIQIQENGVALLVLIEKKDQVAESQTIQSFMANAIKQYLNYPPDKIGLLKFYLKEFEHVGKNIFYGTVDCDFDINSKEAWENRTWWNHTYTWTDGKRIYFSVLEIDNESEEAKQAKPGIKPRFKSSK
jgi:hypothetical protein